MKSRNLILYILLIAFFSSCQPNKWEQENDAVYKSIKKEYRITDDGSVSYHYQHQLKYITHNSFNRLFGESFIIYDPRYQQLKINKAETKMANGKIVKSPDNAFNEVLPGFAAGAPAFNHLREMVVTHTGLELGCVVNFDYEISSRAGYLPYLNDNILLQQYIPVENMEIVVTVPEGKELHYKLINSDVKASISKKDGQTIYTWNFKNLDAVANETNQPAERLFMPRLIFSTTGLNDAIAGVLNSADKSLSDEMKVFVQKRMEGKKQGIEFIKELQKIVGNEINNFNVPIEYTAYTIRPLAEVWASNGATQLEKMVLLNEFASFMGFESKLIFATPEKTFDKAIGNLKDFGKLMMLTKFEDKEIVFQCDPSQNNNLAYQIAEDKIVDANGTEISIPDYVKETLNKVSVIGNIEINELGEYVGGLEVKVSGVNYPYFDMLINPENAKKVVESILPSDAIGKVEVINFDNKGCEVKAEVKGKEIWKNTGEYYNFKLFSSSFGIDAAHLRPLTAKRETPLSIGYPVIEQYEISYSLPAGFEFVGPIVNTEIANTAGEVKFIVESSENKITVNRQLKLEKSTISNADYNGFKALMDGWNKEGFKTLVVKKIQ